MHSMVDILTLHYHHFVDTQTDHKASMSAYVINVFFALCRFYVLLIKK